jgi:hypothetical protein
MRAKAWYVSVYLLWYISSSEIGILSLMVLACNGGVELNPPLQLTASSDKIIGIQSGVQSYVRLFGMMIAINIGLLWLFILLMLPEWFSSSNKIASGVKTFVWISFMVLNILLEGFLVYSYMGTLGMPFMSGSLAVI